MPIPAPQEVLDNALDVFQNCSSSENSNNVCFFIGVLGIFNLRFVYIPIHTF